MQRQADEIEHMAKFTQPEKDYGACRRHHAAPCAPHRPITP